jgi:hypothetical protein
MADSSRDQVAALRRLLAFQHRQCAADKDAVLASRNAICRSKELLKQIAEQESLYTTPFAPQPDARPRRSLLHSIV